MLFKAALTSNTFIFTLFGIDFLYCVKKQAHKESNIIKSGIKICTFCKNVAFLFVF